MAGQQTFLGATITRRAALSSVAVAGIAVAGCSARQASDLRSLQGTDALLRRPLPPGPEHDGYTYLDAHQVRTVEAITARIIPGDADDPGAIEAGVPQYIDRKLNRHKLFPDPAFRQPPFAVGYSPEEDPPEVGPDQIAVPEDELGRYGFQSPLAPRDIYELGLESLDRFAEDQHGELFADLSEAQQDQLLMVLDDARDEDGSDDDENADNAGGADGDGEDADGDDDSGEMEVPEALRSRVEEFFDEVDAGMFFETIHLDTIQGMFADPMYGGNRDLVGWKMIGFPGAQRSYSPHEMLHGTTKEPQAMHDLTEMMPDRPDGGRPALEQHRNHGG